MVSKKLLLELNSSPEPIICLNQGFSKIYLFRHFFKLRTKVNNFSSGNPKIRGSLNKFPDFFLLALLFIVHK